MQIEVNGEAKVIPSGTTVGGLLSLLSTGSTGSTGDTCSIGDGPVAVERNEEIVPRAAHATTELSDGDRIEVVQFVGGG